MDTRKDNAMDKTTNEKAIQASAPPDLLDEAKNAAGKVVHTATEQIARRLDSEKNKAADAMGGVADALRDTAESNGPSTPAGNLGARAADGIEDVADYLQSRSLRDVVGEVEGFARREPAIFLGAAFVLGLVGGRFLKSSARSRASDRHATESSELEGSKTLMTRSRPVESAPPIAVAVSRDVESGLQRSDGNEGRAAPTPRVAPAMVTTDPGRGAAAASAAAAAASAAMVASAAAATAATAAAATSPGNAAHRAGAADSATNAPAQSAVSPNLPPSQDAEAKKASPVASPNSNGSDKSRLDGGQSARPLGR